MIYVCEDMRNAETNGGFLSTYLSVPFNEAGKEREWNSERYMFPSRRTPEKRDQNQNNLPKRSMIKETKTMFSTLPIVS
jgi:hypothetical protein